MSHAKTDCKVSVIGAGSVGAALAQRILESGLADVVLLDVLKKMACAKALDLTDASPIAGHEKKIIGTDDYSHIAASDIVIITAGFARKPGMTREELISKNAEIVRGAAANIKRYAPDSIIIVVTNPLDVMTYLAYKTSGFRREKILGMAGVLDGARFVALIAEELKVPRSSVSTLVLGSHGDTMVPIISKTTIKGKPIHDVLRRDKLDEIVKRTRDRGLEIVNLLGNGSAYYSPSAAAFKMVEAILEDTGHTLAVSAYLDGEYGLKDICIGVPCVLGRRGIEKIVSLDLDEDEESALQKSAGAIKSSIEMLSRL